MKEEEQGVHVGLQREGVFLCVRDPWHIGQSMHSSPRTTENRDGWAKELSDLVKISEYKITTIKKNPQLYQMKLPNSPCSSISEIRVQFNQEWVSWIELLTAHLGMCSCGSVSKETFFFIIIKMWFLGVFFFCQPMQTALWKISLVGPVSWDGHHTPGMASSVWICVSVVLALWAKPGLCCFCETHWFTALFYLWWQVPGHDSFICSLKAPPFFSLLVVIFHLQQEREVLGRGGLVSWQAARTKCCPSMQGQERAKV